MSAIASPYVVSVRPFMIDRTHLAHYTSGTNMRSRTLVILAICTAACGSSTDQGDAGNNPDTGTPTDGSTQKDVVQTGDSGPQNDSASTTTKVVFVIPMENKAQTQIYGNTNDAPYINNTLMAAYPHTTMFTDELPSLNSEPHYVWMEAGKNQFG